MKRMTLGIIGGSGLYGLDSLAQKAASEIEMKTPYGAPSSLITKIEGKDIDLLFLARHGKGHVLLPSEVNFRANIYALKKLGATHLLSISAVGSLKEEIAPGDLVVVSQFIDRTKGRDSTFFGEGVVGHVMFADPVCSPFSTLLYDGAISLGYKTHKNATLVTMEGPAFSTRAESLLHKSMNADLIGMTAMPEAKLAREAELCYGVLALATDYDCWYEGHDDVTADAVVATFKSNVEKAKKVIDFLIKNAVSLKRNSCQCSRALDNAIMTDKKLIPNRIKEKIMPIIGRVL